MRFNSVFKGHAVNRREALRAGWLLFGGLSISDLLRLRAAASGPRAETSVILVWLEGGPSHLETYDLKPQAPVEYRGEFRPVATVMPGMEVCELLPRHALVADKFNLIRSITHDMADHAEAATRVLTGRRPTKINEIISPFPTIEAVVAKARESRHGGMPTHVSNVRRLKGGGSGYLGPTYEPFVVDADPNSEHFQVRDMSIGELSPARLEDRAGLLRQLDRWRAIADRQAAESDDAFQRAALALLTSDKTSAAFDIQRESPTVRDRYGRNEWGQRALLARRLVEAGCSIVTVQMQKFGPAYTWDDHGDGGSIPYLMNARLPPFDQAISALVEDIYQRGLDKKVMLVVTGEFGRAPRLTFRPGSRHPGRDHWPGAMSVLVSGGGMRTGQVIGATNSKGEYPVERSLDPNDLLATVYQFLGIDVSTAYLDLRGRPMPILTSGRPIDELFG